MMEPNPVVYDPVRQCYCADGKAKVCYASFDDAMEMVASQGRRSKRMHAYRCPDNHWHVAGNPIRL